MTIQHIASQHAGPAGTVVRCSCGWSRFVPRQNALARAAKVRRASGEWEAHVAASLFGDRAGYVAAARTGTMQPDGTRGWAVLYDGPSQGIPAEDGGRWTVICEAHSTLNQDTRKSRALAMMRRGTMEFCDCCRQTCGSPWSKCPTCGHGGAE